MVVGHQYFCTVCHLHRDGLLDAPAVGIGSYSWNCPHCITAPVNSYEVLDTDTEFDIETLKFYGHRLTGKYKHYCCEWDFLPIDETVPEFEACTCEFEE